ncbi:hypothetical protein Tco_1338197 [Tanacetum coccineum]
MASFNYRLNPLYAINECSSCGALYTRNCSCSKGSLEDKILVPVPDSSQQPLILEKICLNCGDPVHGLYCRKCAIIRQTLGEVFQDLLNTSESSNDNTNIVSAPQEPFVFNQDPGKNSSQSLPHIDHCCYGCGDSLDDIFCQRCTCESCGKGAHYGYNCPLQVPIISKPEPCNNQTVNEFPQTLPSLHLTSCFGDENSFTYDSKPNFVDDSPKVFNPPPQPPMYSCEFCGNNARYGYYCTPQLMEQMTSICDMVGQIMQKKEEERRITEDQAAKDRYWKIPICYDDDEDYTIAITSVLSTKEPDNSLSMGDEHLDTITSVENHVPIPSEFEGNSDDTCDVPICDDSSTFDALNYHSKILSDSNDDDTSSDDDDFEAIEYVSLEEVNDVDQEEKEFDLEDILQIQDVILREKLLNVKEGEKMGVYVCCLVSAVGIVR